MGDTLRFAERMDLLQMQPQGELASTGYALASRGREYLVLQPDRTADPFTVALAAGTYTVEWFSIDSRRTTAADEVTVEDDKRLSFTAPSAEPEPAVLYLRRTERQSG
jgi:phage baseplate assembly protein gpV